MDETEKVEIVGAMEADMGSAPTQCPDGLD